MTTTYLVTGANRGIGLEFARQLAARGDHVIATTRDPEKAGELELLGERGNVRVMMLDASDAESIDRLSHALEARPIDVLINNAGVSSETRTLGAVSFEALEKVFRVNAHAPLMVTQKLMENLRAGRRKTIVHISSQLASITNNLAPGGGGSSYGYRGSKAALNMMNACLANELRGEGMISVVLHPGWVQTDMGGANAHLTPSESVTQMIGVIDALGPLDSGRFLNFDGKALPW